MKSLIEINFLFLFKSNLKGIALCFILKLRVLEFRNGLLNLFFNVTFILEDPN